MARYALIACEVMRREFDFLAPRSENTIDIFYMDLGLHAAGPEKMAQKLQDTIDRIEQQKYDAILLGYGLCSNGICSLRADIPVVIPRAHDCITLFMGSKQDYRAYFDTHKGTYYVTAGSMGTSLTGELLEGAFSIDALRAEYLEKYDEEEAEYLLDMLGNPLKQYRRITFVNNGVGEVDARRGDARKIALDKGWEFDEFQGNTGILRRLVDGMWDGSEFLVVRPGETAVPAYTEEEIIRAAGAATA
ncbi:MAG: DUF1638 domain-containing protein [Spirochaetaceae bacterium]|nr:DUF1638 domain-containing protein [Spirochaetaceae bacterium]